MLQLRQTLLYMALAMLVAVAANGRSDAEQAFIAGTPRVTVLQIESIIQPVVAEFLIEQFEAADQREDALVVIELSTPGGVLTSTRQITSAMLEAQTPIVVFVYPQGVHAASAGFFVLMAADIAAMAPGTNTGAAHPVGGSGEDIPGDMGNKVEQDTAAMIRSLAKARGRDETLAEEAVIDSRSFSASEALELGLVDHIAEELGQLIERIDGTVIGEGEDSIVLELARARVERVEMTPFQRARSAIADPNIAYMLLSLGGLGLYFEFSNPGASFPGVLGAICFVVGLYGTSVLPVNYAGLALLGLSGFFFLAELKVPSFGLFTLGGVTSLVLGSLMLFSSADPAVRVSTNLVIALAVVALLVAGTVSVLVVKSRGSRVATGMEGMKHETGTVRSTIGPTTVGKAFLHGELWNATSDVEIGVGETIEVVRVDGLTLEVRPHQNV